ncbi:DUF6551 family protein [Rhizobium sp. NFR03]|uniref:DUF6551 family protein n=1 Tax=Rhizobium sp. NFR03 TaxID=1566263 RepID=UPI0008C4A140|nr:DUF6551 family protein [Rhizobium sp. NFR03]SER58408.1 hypothetical protein SAMN03159406_00573 [Rhizobium sp. NFR03]
MTAPKPAIKMEIGEPPELAWVPVTAIRIDDSYQRELKEKRVTQILSDFTWAHFGSVMLVRQSDDTFTCFDGQHRVEAARRHPSIIEVPAAIVELDQPRDEAGAFLGVNVNRTAISTVEKYHAGIEAGDPDMMAVCTLLEEAGCEVIARHGIKPAANRTAAVTAVQRSIKTYGDAAVVSACRTLVAAWPKDTGALHAIMIQALARLYRNNRQHIDEARMTAKLMGKDRKILTGDAETLRSIGGGDATASVAKVLVEIYNKSLQQGQIQIGANR